MKLKEYLKTLEWNSFSTYPKQGENIYLHCITEDGRTHKFFQIKKFNAVSFELTKLKLSEISNQRWLHTWLPADKVDLQQCAAL